MNAETTSPQPPRPATSRAAREALAQAEIDAREAADGGPRLTYAHTDWVFDMTQDACWCRVDGRLRQRNAVNHSIPPEMRRVVGVRVAPAPAPGDPPRGRGRPAGSRDGRIVQPFVDIADGVYGDLTVEDSTWWPGHPQIIRDLQVTLAGAHPAPGQRLFNTYRPPVPMGGDARRAGRWTEHVKRLWPDPLDHVFFFDYCAHMVQKPYEKCNTAIVLSGAQGIGKDAALVPLSRAVGGLNFHSIDPDAIFSAFKPWVQAVMLVVNEVRPANDDHRATDFYNVMKPYIAAPPEGLALNEKYTKERYVVNVMRVFMTTNDRMAMFLPEEDRRMHIMHSELSPQWEIAAGEPRYFEDLFEWLMEQGGTGDVVAWLWERDLSQFHPRISPPKTNGWRAVATTWGEPEDGITTAIEALGRPEVVFGLEIAEKQFDDREDVLRLLKSRHRFTTRMGLSGYDPVPSADGKTFQYTRSRAVFKSRSAFKLRAAALTDAQATQALHTRGYALAEARAKEL